MAQTQNIGQDTVQVTRRDFLRTLLAAAVGGIIGGGIVYSGLSNIGGLKQYTDTQAPYTSTPEPKTKTVTITETSTYKQPPVTKTVTETETVTETKTETLTKPSQTTTTTTTVQGPITLEKIVFGNSNLEFIPLKVLDAKVDGDVVKLELESPITGMESKLEIPVEYLSRGNINIGKIFSKVGEYNSNNKSNYSVYFVLGRANIDKAIKHGDTWKPDASKMYYSIIISNRDWKDVYNALKSVKDNKAIVLMPTLDKAEYLYAVWGGSNYKINNHDGKSIIIVYQNKQQVDEATDKVKLASYILGKPDDKNPSGSGTLIVATITTVEYKGTYENGAPIVAVDEYKGTYIVFIHQKGGHLISNW
ncbi:MAG: twin-arginine translocation signal domain-containing protein [Candidatus Nanopusillus sp.]|nr:twin-arginine translocation signal domain-containing protein [Candidatus Nanopusillus sp.]